MPKQLPEPEGRASAHLYLTDLAIGEYVGLLDVTLGHNPEDPRYELKLSLDELEGLELHLKNTINALKHRMLRDAIAGDCRRCKNSRMVDLKRHGRVTPQGEYCPICKPKIDKVLATLREGRPPVLGKVVAKKTRKS